MEVQESPGIQSQKIQQENVENMCFLRILYFQLLKSMFEISFPLKKFINTQSILYLDDNEEGDLHERLLQLGDGRGTY